MVIVALTHEGFLTTIITLALAIKNVRTHVIIYNRIDKTNIQVTQKSEWSLLCSKTNCGGCMGGRIGDDDGDDGLYDDGDKII